MKLKCVKNKVRITSGHYDPRIPNFYVEDSITVGKTYECHIVPMTKGETRIGSGNITTEVQFLVYNDSKYWRTYDTDLFAPLEAE